MSPYDRQRNARLASNARADAKRVDHDDLDCYEDDWAYYEPLTDVDSYPDEDYDPTYYGECNYEFGEPRKQLAEPVWPPTEAVKEYLEALWSLEDARRQALGVKAAAKSALTFLPKDVTQKTTDAVFVELDAEIATRAKLVGSVLEQSRYEWVTPRVERWYNPAADLPDEFDPREYKAANNGYVDWY
jgi:hypothetical protein